MWTNRTEILITKTGVQTLKNASVAVIGVGGVGGYVAYLLCRAGVENITLVDFDTVSQSNINRQIVANTTTVGQFKVDVMKDEILKINPNCKVVAIKERVTQSNLNQLNLSSCNFVVDAIDSVQDKVSLICFCKQKNINIISAMGAGNRLTIPNFKVMDIYKTSNDGLAKIMRKKLRENGVDALNVVSCEDKALKTDSQQIGSISYFPAMCGCVLSAHVINSLLK